MRSSLFLYFVILASVAPFGLSAVVTITVTATSSTARSKPSDSPSYKDLGLFRKAILESHNLFREQHNATALSWNHSLASDGVRWAKGCVWKHSVGLFNLNSYQTKPIHL